MEADTPAPAVIDLLGEIAAALAPALSADAVGATIFKHVLPAIGSRAGALWRVNPAAGMLEMVGVEGLDSAFIEPFRGISLESKLPAAEAVRLRAPIYVHDASERNTRWPILTDSPDGVEALALLPLTTDDRVVGCLTLGFPTPHAFGSNERRLLRALAAQCALALDRSLLHESVRRTADRAHLLSEVIGILTEPAEPDELAQRVANACVPAFGDWCAVYRADESVLRRAGIAVAGRPDLTPLLVDRYPVPVGADSLVAEAYRSGRTRLYPRVTPTLVESSSPDPEFLELLQQLTVSAGIAIPIWSQDERLGVITFAFKDTAREFDHELITVLEQVADRTGIALSRVVNFRRTRAIAEALQQVVLPNVVPSVPGIVIAVRYATSGDGNVGGDWWDSLVLPDGRLGVSVGDVAGHGLPAAATMSQMRIAIRTHLIDGKTAGAALGASSSMLRYVDPAAMATSIVASYNAGDHVLSWSNAGHPPPLLVSDQGASYLARDPSPPLGLGTMTYPVHAAVLPERFRLFLFTDGLVEGRAQPLDDGMARLAKVVLGIRADEDLETQCEQLIAAMDSGNRDDDVTVVAMAVL